jgi:hypothetical protein
MSLEVIIDNYKIRLTFLEHMFHYSNLENILKYGILSHNEAYKNGLIRNDISDNEVQNIRKSKRDTIYNRSLHDYASFYFNSKNPMLYKRKDIQDEILIALADIDILNHTSSIFTDGNAANYNPNPTNFFQGINNLNKIPFATVFADSWNDDDNEMKKEKKRIKCAEALIYPNLPTNKIAKIICPSRKMHEYVSSRINIAANCNHINIEENRSYYF